jgi:hypothetical protein
MSYRLLIDDNFHYMDADHRYEHGVFETKEEAIAAAKAIVDEFLTLNHEPGMTAEELYHAYTGFGDDPFIVGPEYRVLFSAWDYAKARSQELVNH